MLTVQKKIKERKIFEILSSESRLYNILQNSAIIREISYSNLETGRYSPKSGVSQIIRES